MRLEGIGFKPLIWIFSNKVRRWVVIWRFALAFLIVRIVIKALPATYQEVSRRIDWQYALLAEYYFATVTGIIHAILRVQSAHGGPEDMPMQAFLLRVMASVESALSHPSWKANPDTESQVVRAVCLPGSHPSGTNAHAFLSTLAHLAAGLSAGDATASAPKIVTANVLRIVHDCLAAYDRAQMAEAPELVRVHKQLGLLSTRTKSLCSENVLHEDGRNAASTSGKLHGTLLLTSFALVLHAI